MSVLENEMQNIDEALLHSIFPSIDIDDWTKFKKASSIQQQKNFFNKYEIANKNNYGFSSKIPIKNTNELPYDCNIYFDINEVGFYVNYENRSEKELFSNMKSNFIINQDLSESKYYPYLFGTTIRKLIKRNQEAHVINETDKLLWCLQISIAMSYIYNENSSSAINDNCNHVKISDETFWIDSMKNAYLINPDKHYYETNNKEEDLYSCGILFEEIFKETLPNEKILTNRNIQWCKNYRNDFDRILNKFPHRRNTYTEFKQIINDLKSTFIYKYKKDEIESRLNNANLMTTKCSFNNLIFSAIGGIVDINETCREFLIKLRNQTEKGSDYYLFFNLILHIYFPDVQLIERKIDYIDFLNSFNTIEDLQNKIDLLIEQYLPNIDELECQIKQDIAKEINLNKQEIDLLMKCKEIIKNELNGNGIYQKNLQELLQKIYNYYFPCSFESINNDEEIFDYFGMFYFIKYKNDIIRLVHSNINEKNIERLNNIPNECNFISYIDTCTNKFCVLDFADKFDLSHLYNRLFYNVKKSCFYLNRKFQYDEYEEYQKMVRYQDELFQNINSKYILHLDPNESNLRQNMKSSTSNISFLPTTLLHIIRRNDSNRIINDSDKILWAIQIATAFRDLEKYQKENENKKNFVDFKSCIYDQSFFIDSFKNIYLGTLAYCTEEEKSDAVTNGPIYFRSSNNSSYVYTYGVLLNEIITEIEPKNLFENMSRIERMKILNNGYKYFDNFTSKGQIWYDRYGNDIKEIVYKCINNDIKDFDVVLMLLKETKLYKKFKYVIDKRDEKAEPFDSKRKSTFKSLLISEIAGIDDMHYIFLQFFKNLEENCEKEEYQQLFDSIYKELNQSNHQISYFNAFNNLFEL